MAGKLKPIVYDEELSAFDLAQTAPCDDRLTTCVTLDDYDWMEYTFSSLFPTWNQGMLDITVTYFGTTESEMKVIQRIDENTVFEHVIQFPSDIFKEFIKDFLTKHIASWDETYAFCGEKEAVEFYNKILNNATVYHYALT